MNTSLTEKLADNKDQLNYLLYYVKTGWTTEQNVYSTVIINSLRNHTHSSNKKREPVHKIAIKWKMTMEIKYSVIKINDMMVNLMKYSFLVKYDPNSNSLAKI